MTDVTVVGTGVTGSAIVRACVDSGLVVSVWNRTPERSARLAGRDVHLHATAAEAIETSPIVLLCLLNYEITHAVLDDAGADLSGRLVVQSAAGVPDDVAPLRERVEAAGGRYLEAAILNYPDAIGTEDCFTVYSGAAEDFKELAGVTEALSGKQVRLGADPAYAKAYHVVSSAFHYAFVSGFLECSAIAESIGVPLHEFAESVPLYDPAFRNTICVGLGLIARRDYTFEQAPLTSHLDVLNNLAGIAERAGIDRSYLGVMRERVLRAMEQGYRREHVAVLTEQFRSRRAAVHNR
ncbi:NAD(P)-binding domain-containing protein [Streptosporangium sp. NPDC006930]|uniref:NAD(P)-binding domain-containing protein n=1 Tax=unclassified Streptosporangium TaxID=2632669 RepID=UPI003448139C